MKKTIKYFISFITLFILLVFIYTIFFFNPDSFKDEIGEYISSKIQYKFTYNSTAWSYDPNPSISMKEIKIIDDSITPNKKIVDIEEAVIAISKENLMNQIIDAEEVAASNLIYYGVNIDEILMKTYSLIKFKKFSTLNEVNSTKIYHLYSTAKIINENMQINDIEIKSELLQARGTGVINLVSKEVSFNMEGRLRDQKSLRQGVYKDHYPQDLHGKVLPIRIQGKMDDLKISIDLEDIIINEIISPLKDKLIEKIQDDLKEKIKLPF
tara:strand:+ start:8135 stop:8938 length:804 start_codon:yes stop_codon:yes gene_type:complete